MMVEKIERCGNEEDGGKRRQCKCEKNRSEKRLSPSPSIPLFFSTSPSHHILCFCQVSTRSCCAPHLFFLPPFPLLPLLHPPPFPASAPHPHLLCLLIRAGGTIVPLLALFGNPGLKQSLFTQPVAQPEPSSSLQWAKSD